MDKTDPLRFGPYAVTGQIGSGGMGVVYRARDERLQREVAVKVLHRQSDVPGARERFLREARAVSSLNHPNICTVFDIGEQEGDPYLVMELLQGESLRDRVERGSVTAPRELAIIAQQCALALAAAHDKGIVHRDIKPANLFLVANPLGEVHVKVLDFGLAKTPDDPQHHSISGLTMAGSTVGTVEYMSPEQARGEPLDPRSDLFSLGSVLYELATGEVPFPGATSAIVFAALLSSTPAPARHAVRGGATDSLPRHLDAIIQKLLQKQLAARYQSANDVLADLRRLHPAEPSKSNRVSLTAIADASAQQKEAQPSVQVPLPEPGSAREIPGAPTSPIESLHPDTWVPTNASRPNLPVAGDPSPRAQRPAPPSGVRITSSMLRVESIEDVPEQQPSENAVTPPRRFRIVIVAVALLLLAAVAFALYKHASAVAEDRTAYPAPELSGLTLDATETSESALRGTRSPVDAQSWVSPGPPW